MDQTVLDDFEKHLLIDDRGQSEFEPRWFKVLADGVVDILLDRRFDDAEPVRGRLRAVLDRFVARHGLEIEDGAGFIAGQLAGLTRVLAAASERTVAKSVIDTLRVCIVDKKYRELLKVLAEGEELSSKQIAERIKQDPAVTSRKLTNMRNAGLVFSYGIGREVYSKIHPDLNEVCNELLGISVLSMSDDLKRQFEETRVAA